MRGRALRPNVFLTFIDTSHAKHILLTTKPPGELPWPPLARLGRKKVPFFKILCPPGRNAARGNAWKIPKVPFFKNFCPPGRNVARGNASEIPKVPYFQKLLPPGKERCLRKCL